MDKLSAQDLLMIMLRSGWSWGVSPIMGYMCLTKDSTTWDIDPFNLTFQDLICAMERNAHSRGKEGKSLYE